jgi:ParB family transcriptional regulator, chromosome partitioning protein
VAEKRPALGRGLSALIPEAPPTPPPAPQAAPAPTKDTPPTEVDLDLIAPNPYQPRLNFDEAKLEELAQSIRANGLIQPIVVRRAGNAKSGSASTTSAAPAAAGTTGATTAPYEIIAGERRWRAAQRAGLLRVPVLVKDVPDEKLLEVALIENIQREDLNPIDEALAYRRLIDDFKLTQEALASAVGKDRSSVANFLRLLKLPDSVRKDVASGALSMGHARALLAIEQPEALERAAREVLDGKLSVRETEALAKKANEPPPAEPSPAEAVAAPEPPADVHTRKAEETMRLSLGTRVHIRRKGKGGRIEIEFVSEDELHRLYEYITDRR